MEFPLSSVRVNVIFPSALLSLIRRPYTKPASDGTAKQKIKKSARKANLPVSQNLGYRALSEP
jgi:hypothetical protein